MPLRHKQLRKAGLLIPRSNQHLVIIEVGIQTKQISKCYWKVENVVGVPQHERQAQTQEYRLLCTAETPGLTEARANSTGTCLPDTYTTGRHGSCLGKHRYH